MLPLVLDRPKGAWVGILQAVLNCSVASSQPKKGGGISFNSTVTLTQCSEKLVQLILHEYSILFLKRRPLSLKSAARESGGACCGTAPLSPWCPLG